MKNTIVSSIATLKKMTTRSLVLGLCLIIGIANISMAQSFPDESGAGQPPPGTKISVANLDEQVAYHRAFEATLWFMPALGIKGLTDGFMKDSGERGMDYNDIMAQSKPFNQGVEAFTVNTVTPYILAFANLKDGPVVLEVPAQTKKNRLYGQIVDAWQITIADVGPAGIDKGKGAKYLLLPPGYSKNIPAGYTPVKSKTNQVGFAFRSVRGPGASIADAYTYSKTLRMYPLSTAANPKKQRFFDTTRMIHTLPPYGFGTLEQIKEFIDTEPARPRDKVMMGMLASLGIEKGKAFEPDPLLKDAMIRGVHDAYFYMHQLADELHESSLYWPDRHWSMVMKPDANKGFSFEDATTILIDDRAAAWHFFSYYPKILSDKAGTVYLAPIKDAKGRLVEAGKNYSLHIPADIPAEQFWSLTMYDHATWSFINNELNRSGLSSFQKDKLKVNKDGSVDLYFGPTAPKGMESNWLPTEGKRPYVWLRLYGPGKAFWDKSFVMPDVKRLD
jgi:hypothetical protein